MAVPKLPFKPSTASGSPSKLTAAKAAHRALLAGVLTEQYGTPETEESAKAVAKAKETV